MLSLAERVRRAHGDWWETEGRLRRNVGGGTARVTGARLSCSGLSAVQWNGGDVHALPVDLDAARRWYTQRGVPWGLRVPVGVDFKVGRYVFTARCMGLETGGLTGADPHPPGVVLRRATPSDLTTFAAIDAAAFDFEVELTVAWVSQALGTPGWTHWVALAAEEIVGITSVCHTDLSASACAAISGIAVKDQWRRRGIGSALTRRAVTQAFTDGATLAHLNPDTDAAARIYARLGFREVPGFNVYRMD